MESEFEDQYDQVMATDETQEVEERMRGEILKGKIRFLEPYKPICVSEHATADEAIRAIVASEGHTGACVVDDAGKLIGIFTERDVLCRVVAKNLVASEVLLKDVMTPDPEALTPNDTIAFGLNRMSSQGFRTIPLVDENNAPIGILFTRHFVRFIVSLFPKATMNLPPGTSLKNPDQIHGG